MHGSPNPHHAMLAHGSTFTTILFSNSSTDFICSTICFLFFQALDASPILFLAESLACFVHDTLLPLRLLKWG
jgi:hypothetical protein